MNFVFNFVVLLFRLSFHRYAIGASLNAAFKLRNWFSLCLIIERYFDESDFFHKLNISFVKDVV
uniref:Secreted protein n=1 Tax=Schistosoma curassoni TaxID=6186 RepID=A0A183KBU1_9TREM